MHGNRFVVREYDKLDEIDGILEEHIAPLAA